MNQFGKNASHEAGDKGPCPIQSSTCGGRQIYIQLDSISCCKLQTCSLRIELPGQPDWQRPLVLPHSPCTCCSLYLKIEFAQDKRVIPVKIAIPKCIEQFSASARNILSWLKCREMSGNDESDDFCRKRKRKNSGLVERPRHAKAETPGISNKNKGNILPRWLSLAAVWQR